MSARLSIIFALPLLGHSKIIMLETVWFRFKPYDNSILMFRIQFLSFAKLLKLQLTPSVLVSLRVGQRCNFPSTEGHRSLWLGYRREDSRVLELSLSSASTTSSSDPEIRPTYEWPSCSVQSVSSGKRCPHLKSRIYFSLLQNWHPSIELGCDLFLMALPPCWPSGWYEAWTQLEVTWISCYDPQNRSCNIIL